MTGRPAPHPDPPAELAGRTLLLVETGQSWFRTHNSNHPAIQFGRTGFNRFDAPDAGYGVLYVANDEHGAFIETFGQATGVNTLTLTALSSRRLARVRPLREMRLVNLADGGGLTRIGADNRICDGDHVVARRWSRALHDHPSRPDGLYYRARHDPARFACAFFEHVEADLGTDDLGLWSARQNEKVLSAILDTYGFGLIFE